MIYEIITKKCPGLVRDFIYGQNKNDGANIGFCSDSVEQLTEDIDELLQYDYNSIVCRYDGDALVGLAAFDIDCDKNRTEIWGPFVAEEYQSDFTQISGNIISYATAQNKCRGELCFFPNRKNNRVIAYIEGSGASFMGFHITYRIEEGETSGSRADTAGISAIEPSQYHEFIDMHDSIFPNTYYSGREIIDKLDAKNKVFTAHMNGKLIGYVYSEFDAVTKRGSIEFLGVVEDSRKKGCGETLLRAALYDLFRANNAAYVELCVSSKNDTAAGLYKKVGFRASKEYLFFRK